MYMREKISNNSPFSPTASTVGRSQTLDGYKLHGPPMFAVKAKIYGVLYKQSSSVAFDETSSYWLAPKNS